VFLSGIFFSFDVWEWRQTLLQERNDTLIRKHNNYGLVNLQKFGKAGNWYLEEMHGDFSNLCEGHRKKIHVCFDLDVTKGRSL
jgi:hypothetical protein